MKWKPYMGTKCKIIRKPEEKKTVLQRANSILLPNYKDVGGKWNNNQVIKDKNFQ